MRFNVQEYKAFKKGEKNLPGHLAIQKEETNKLFKNKLLERLTRTHVLVPVIMHSLISIGVMIYSTLYVITDVGQSALIYIIGLLSWSFTEYMVHRFVYHTETNSDRFYTVQFSAHGIHHQHPRDKSRLALPPLPALILASGFFGLFYLLMGNYAYSFFPGFLTGYVLYISLHYAQHIIKAPKYYFWKKLWEEHAWHHYKDPYAAFGVSTRLWDYIFGTTMARSKKRMANRQ